MIRVLQPDLIQIRGCFVISYLLIDGEDVHLIDGGFLGHISLIERALKERGLTWSNVKTILMTHGHLDHTYNVAEIVDRSGAQVFGHGKDLEHFAGRYPYRGIARVCGFLECLGRLFLGGRPAVIDQELHDGQVLDFWGGLRVVHTPGHTEGHCGFYSLRENLYFPGDLFTTGKFGTALAPGIFNSCPECLSASVAKVLTLKPVGILGNHCDHSSPEIQWQRFQKKFGSSN